MAQLVMQELQQVRLTRLITAIVAAPTHAQGQDLLTTNLRVLQSLPCVALGLRLHGWQASRKNILALQHLPAWRHDLYLRLGTCGVCVRNDWPIASASEYIPSSYRTWWLDQKHLTRAECEAFVQWLPSDRTAKGPLTVKVTGADVSWLRWRGAKIPRHVEVLLDPQCFPTAEA